MGQCRLFVSLQAAPRMPCLDIVYKEGGGGSEGKIKAPTQIRPPLINISGGFEALSRGEHLSSCSRFCVCMKKPFFHQVDHSMAGGGSSMA